MLVLLLRPREREGGEADRNRWWWWGAGEEGGDNNNDNQEGGEGENWWQRFWNGERRENRERRGGGLLLWFIYLYTLALYVGMVWYGHGVYRRGGWTLPLLMALFLMGNLGLLLAMVLGSSVRIVVYV